MNKKTLVIIGVVFALVIVLIVFFVMSNKAEAPAVTSEQISEDEIPESEKSSIKELIASGQPQKCTFKNSADTNNTSGTIYIAGEKVRGYFSSNVNNKPTQSHIIVENNIMYTWIDGTKTGNKISRAADEEWRDQATLIDQKVHYVCEQWLEDSEIFARPANVTFTEYKD